jgi:hypothetical protein
MDASHGHVELLWLQIGVSIAEGARQASRILYVSIETVRDG